MRSLLGIYRLAKIGLYIIGCLFMVAFVLPHSDPKKRGRLIRVWARKLPEMIGIVISHEGKLQCPDAFDSGITTGEIGRLLVSNHVTFLDPFVIDAVLPAGFVAKAEIGRWPVLGRIASAVGTIYIDRGNKRALLGIADSMEKALQQGRNVLVFPEGTTSSGTGLLKLHSNLFEASARTGAPTIPIVLQYKKEGVPTTIPAWTGHESLMKRLWAILCSTGLSVTVNILSPLVGDNRHELCQQTSVAMARKLGIEESVSETQQEH